MRSASIFALLPSGNILSSYPLPGVNLPFGNGDYAHWMIRAADQQKVFDIRQRRLRELLRAYGSIQELANAIGESHSYTSRMLSLKEHRKNIGEAKARQIEVACGKGRGWLDGEERAAAGVREDRAPYSAREWPFDLELRRITRLNDAQREELEALIEFQLKRFESQNAEQGKKGKRPPGRTQSAAELQRDRN